MQVFYRDKFIKNVGSEEEARKFIEEYNNFVKAAYPDLFNRLETPGKEFFREDYISTYVHNPEKYMYGWVLKEGNTETMDSLANIGLEICVNLAIDPMFEIK